jgi:hypothetical protein
LTPAQAHHDSSAIPCASPAPARLKYPPGNGTLGLLPRGPGTSGVPTPTYLARVRIERTKVKPLSLASTGIQQQLSTRRSMSA